MFVLAAEGRDKGCVAPLQVMIWCCQLKRNNSWWKIKNMNHVKCIYFWSTYTHILDVAEMEEQSLRSVPTHLWNTLCVFFCFVSLRQMILNAWSSCGSISFCPVQSWCPAANCFAFKGQPIVYRLRWRVMATVWKATGYMILWANRLRGFLESKYTLRWFQIA